MLKVNFINRSEQSYLVYLICRVEVVSKDVCIWSTLLKVSTVSKHMAEESQGSYRAVVLFAKLGNLRIARLGRFRFT